MVRASSPACSPACQPVAAVTALLIIGAHGWSGAGRFLTTLTIGGLTGLLAALTVALLAGGYATTRRVAV